MARNYITIFIAGCAISITPAVAKDKAPQLSGLELQQMQARDIETTKDVAFPAVMTVLQDAGYNIQSADKDTGFINAQASTSSKTTFNILWGFGKKKKTPVVTAFVEQRGPSMTRVRLNFVMSEAKNRVYGFNSADEEPILDPAVYRDVFEKIDKEVFVRHAMGVAPSVQPVSNIGVPVASAAPVPSATPVAVAAPTN